MEKQTSLQMVKFLHGSRMVFFEEKKSEKGSKKYILIFVVIYKGHEPIYRTCDTSLFSNVSLH